MMSKISVADIISRDGWAPNHLYGDAVALFKELRETGLKSMVARIWRISKSRHSGLKGHRFHEVAQAIYNMDSEKKRN